MNTYTEAHWEVIDEALDDDEALFAYQPRIGGELALHALQEAYWSYIAAKLLERLAERQPCKK